MVLDQFWTEFSPDWFGLSTKRWTGLIGLVQPVWLPVHPESLRMEDRSGPGPSQNGQKDWTRPDLTTLVLGRSRLLEDARNTPIFHLLTNLLLGAFLRVGASVPSSLATQIRRSCRIERKVWNIEDGSLCICEVVSIIDNVPVPTLIERNSNSHS